MNMFIKTLLKNTRNEGWNQKNQVRYPNSECDAFYASESNQFLCYGIGIEPMRLALYHHYAIWKAHSLADRCFRYSDKYFKHPTGRSYFNPKYRKVHKQRVMLFYERIMMRKMNKLLQGSMA